MIDIQDNLQTPLQPLCTPVLDAISNEIDNVVNLLSEGKKLLEIMDGEENFKEIKTIVHNINSQLFQHAIRMNALKYKIRQRK